MDFVYTSLGLFASAFISATLFPAASEAAFIALIWQQPAHAWQWFAIASLGNTLGSLTSYAIGCRLPAHGKINPRAIMQLQRHGTKCLFFSWLPFVGDALPLAAGWLRLPFWQCVCWIAMGKSLRYSILLFTA